MGVSKSQWGWKASFWFQKKCYKKEGFRTRAEAKDWEVDRRRELEEEAKRANLTSPPTFFDISAQYLEDCQARMQLNTWRQKAFVCRSFLEHLDYDPPAEDITKQQVADYLRNRQQTVSNKAANRDLRDIKALYNWAIRRDILFRNPCNGLEFYPEDPTPRYIPPSEDIDKVLMAAEPEEMDLLLILYHTGARVGEVLRMTWEDVNLEKRWVRLWTRKRRGGNLQEDMLPMNETLHGILQRRWRNRNKESPHVFPEYRHEGRRRKESTYRMMQKLCRRAGVKPFGFHTIRHYVASIIQDSRKATLQQIQKFLRHRRQTTTENYLHMIDRSLQEAVDILEEKQPAAAQPQKSK